MTLKPRYQSQASDTCIEVEIIQFNLWRQMQPAKRLALASAATRGCRQLALSGIKKRNPQLDSVYLKQEFIKATLGQEFIKIAQLLETKLVMQDPIWLAAKIGNILDIAFLKKVRYALCPMPYALCPMPYAHEYLIFLRKAIHCQFPTMLAVQLLVPLTANPDLLRMQTLLSASEKNKLSFSCKQCKANSTSAILQLKTL